MSSTTECSDVHENAAGLIPWLINGTLGGEGAARLRAHLADCPQCRSDFEAEQRLFEAIRSESPLVLPGERSFDKLLARIEADESAVPDGRPVEARPSEPCVAGSQTSDSRTDQPARGAERQSGERGHSVHRGRAKRRSAPRLLRRPSAAVQWLTAAVVLETMGLGLGAWILQGRGAKDVSAHSSVESASPGAAPHSSSAPYRTLTSPPPPEAAGPRVRVVFRAELSLDRLQKLLQEVGAHIVDGPTEAHVYTLGFAAGSATALDARIAALRADPDVLFAEPANERPP